MTIKEVIAELTAKYPKAKLSPSVQHGTALTRATKLKFKKEKGFTFVGKDTDGTEVMVYYNDTADAISCTEIESFSEDD
ncbi:hypothetical protein [Limnoglobus roseus]|uniref:Uncharacterized protein n=1 Tax=Limnoglobus roseus TaxID=2598579 RepID=A0A5C1ANI2_9BACT|nr:hypothetical protein [Limnoglobus roseus]QEL19302.1 hypothetical protein PX52LOC_06367 [Limnoglobus roseus]